MKVQNCKYKFVFYINAELNATQGKIASGHNN